MRRGEEGGDDEAMVHEVGLRLRVDDVEIERGRGLGGMRILLLKLLGEEIFFDFRHRSADSGVAQRGAQQVQPHHDLIESLEGEPHAPSLVRPVGVLDHEIQTEQLGVAHVEADVRHRMNGAQREDVGREGLALVDKGGLAEVAEELGGHVEVALLPLVEVDAEPVSYTHLTLPTIA